MERCVDNLTGNGITELVIVTGYLEEQIVSFVRERYPHLSVEFIYNAEYATTNNIYSLWLTRKQVAGHSVLLLDSDILFDARLIAQLLDSPEASALALNRHPLGEEEIKVIPDAEGRVKEISKTCSVSEAIGESIGIEKMSASYVKALFEELELMIVREGETGVFYEKAFERLIAKGETFGIVDTTSFFSMELDTVEDFEQATEKIPPHLL